MITLLRDVAVFRQRNWHRWSPFERRRGSSTCLRSRYHSAFQKKNCPAWGWRRGYRQVCNTEWPGQFHTTLSKTNFSTATVLPWHSTFTFSNSAWIRTSIREVTHFLAVNARPLAGCHCSNMFQLSQHLFSNFLDRAEDPLIWYFVSLRSEELLGYFKEFLGWTSAERLAQVPLNIRFQISICNLHVEPLLFGSSQHWSCRCI